MKSTAVVLAALIAVAAHAEEEPFNPSRNDLTMTITVKMFPNAARLREVCTDLGAQVNVNEPGCCVTDTEAKTATIYVLKPRSSEDMERIGLFGHEALHPFFGRYHEVH